MLLNNYRNLQGAIFKDEYANCIKRSGSVESMRIYNTVGNKNDTSIVIGTSDTPVDRSQYDLVEPVTENIVESNKAMFTKNDTVDFKIFYRFTSVITNNSINAITIREIGLLSKYKDVLLIREVVSPYVLEPGESVLISISIE